MTKKTTAAPIRLHPSAEAYRRWVIDGLTHLNLKHKVLEPVLGSQTTISKVLNGKRPLRLEEVAEISTKIFGPGYPPPNGASKPTPTATPQAGMVGEETPSDDLPIEAIIAPGSWVRGGVMATAAPSPRVPIARMGAKFANMRQYACPTLADPSNYVICVPFAAVRASPIAGEKVHVRRTRANGEHEDTVRVVRGGGQGGIRLELEGEPTSQPDWSINYPSDRDGETIEIRGLVIGRYIAENV